VVGPWYQTRKAVGSGTVGSVDGGDLRHGGDGGGLANVFIALFLHSFFESSPSLGYPLEDGNLREKENGEDDASDCEKS